MEAARRLSLRPGVGVEMAVRQLWIPPYRPRLFVVATAISVITLAASSPIYSAVRGSHFSKAMESVARQPEASSEVKPIMWLGFALVEAVVFYALVGAMLAHTLI